ncbi:MAG: thioesterase family protein [Polyangiales bacterium]|nr:YbgC/FadM family acyl-CoA thioesterase [Myxococcales bacterium]
MSEATNAHLYRVRVGYADTDQGGVVHHAVYLRWLEQGRVELLRDRGVDVRTLEREERATIVVTDAELRYRQPARFDDLVDIETTVLRRGFASILFGYRVLRDDVVLAEAKLKLACISLESGRARRWPEGMAKALA